MKNLFENQNKTTNLDDNDSNCYCINKSKFWKLRMKNYIPTSSKCPPRYIIILFSNIYLLIYLHITYANEYPNPNIFTPKYQVPKYILIPTELL